MNNRNLHIVDYDTGRRMRYRPIKRTMNTIKFKQMREYCFIANIIDGYNFEFVIVLRRQKLPQKTPTNASETVNYNACFIIHNKKRPHQVGLLDCILNINFQFNQRACVTTY